MMMEREPGETPSDKSHHRHHNQHSSSRYKSEGQRPTTSSSSSSSSRRCGREEDPNRRSGRRPKSDAERKLRRSDRSRAKSKQQSKQHPKPEGVEEEEWAPAQLTMGKGKTGSSRSNGGQHRRSRQGSDRSRGGDEYSARGGLECTNESNMFESFRNLEGAMALAMEESLKSQEGLRGGGGALASQRAKVRKDERERDMIQSFRNLDMALVEAQKNSMRDNTGNRHQHDNMSNGRNDGNGKKSSLYESFTNLDAATAQAIRNSLSDRGKGLFESFQNLDGAMNEAMQNSIREIKKNNEEWGTDAMDNGCGRDGSMIQSFRDLDAAMAQAIKNSLDDSSCNDKQQGASKFDIMERLEEGAGIDSSSRSYDYSIGNNSVASDNTNNGFRSSRGGGGYVDPDSITEMLQEKQRSHRRRSMVDRDSDGIDNSARSGGVDGSSRSVTSGMRASNHSAGSVDFVDEPAPYLSRHAMRRANRRFSHSRRSASLNYGDEKEEEDIEPTNGSAAAGTAANDSNPPLMEASCARWTPPVGRELTRQHGARTAPRRHSSLTNVQPPLMEGSCARWTPPAGRELTRQHGARAAPRRHSSLTDVGISSSSASEEQDAISSLHYANGRCGPGSRVVASIEDFDLTTPNERRQRRNPGL